LKHIYENSLILIAAQKVLADFGPRRERRGRREGERESEERVKKETQNKIEDLFNSFSFSHLLSKKGLINY
jgi:hypothetical protein